MAIPQPEPSRSEWKHGCPVVDLYDPADDVASFFRAIFDPEFFLPPPAQVQFQDVARVLRLATKYDVQYLRRRALSHLHNSYPTTLDGFDHRLANRTVPFCENAPFAVVALARELDLSWLLPAALYCCCTSSYATFFAGVPWNNGKDRIHLGSMDKRICVLGRSQLIKANNHDIYGFLRSGSISPRPSLSSSRTPSPCHSSSSSSSISRTSSPSHPSTTTSLVNHKDCANARLRWCEGTLCDEECYPLARNFAWTQFRDDVCSACYRRCRSNFEEARLALWNALPGIFELPSWDRLEALRLAAIEG
jgi:hypothetical protein